MKRISRISCIIAVLILLCNFLPTMASAQQNDHDGKQVAAGTKGMVAASTPEATKVGEQVLKDGGNAVDAAIAMQFALNVSEPMMSGIGGGGFMMVYNAKNHKTSIIDSREKAPAGAKPDMFLDKNGKVIPFPVRSTNGKAVGIPGTLKGLMAAHDKWGTKPFKQLIDPSIKLAEKGIKVNWVLADAIKENKNKFNKAAQKVFLKHGKPLKEGDWLKQKDLAQTFKDIRDNGVNDFYKGAIAKDIANVVQDNKGSMKTKDLKNYHVTIDQPLTGTYRGYKLETMPPPSSGGLTVLQILKLLEGFDMKDYGIRSPEKYHLITEAMHLAYADRGAYIGDPKFVKVPEQGMLNPKYIEKRRSLIKMGQANKTVKPGDPWKYQSGKPDKPIVKQPDDKQIGQTTHFTVADKWGNLVSYTTTIEQEFGTGIMVPGRGFMLNNELTDFDAVPGGANEVRPNKRPMSSMSPTIIFKDGKPFMTVGSPGGSTIIASVAETIINVIDYHMDLKDAIEEPRIYSPAYPNIQWEKGIPEKSRQKLTEWGGQWDKKPSPIGNVQSIRIYHDPDFYIGACDSTRQGQAAGIFH
ncbi:gamma-glutamyltranspeptidase/glutathione hydrolase [Scopulibacillus daqui]|uniref:Glutathione hydrolase proenzyme n=1 Tax=Scopulibacillus daqui TaxID=1469162 RepID=A0ABS2PYB7_9BACL|nr:gamma-glutamyltransferase [Scopulibacillus daqui]MBM7644856.1 gamma-glutamyltranspeptidase/glutathione hydrolase [Scopulibacillus daqui]